MKSLEDFIAHFNIKSDLPALEKAVNVKTRKKRVRGNCYYTHRENMEFHVAVKTDMLRMALIKSMRTRQITHPHITLEPN